MFASSFESHIVVFSIVKVFVALFLDQFIWFVFQVDSFR